MSLVVPITSALNIHKCGARDGIERGGSNTQLELAHLSACYSEGKQGRRCPHWAQLFGSLR